jgi:hypothetical protein
MKLLDKYIIFTGDKVRKSMFAKPPFIYFEVTPYPNTFCKNNPRFFCNYKNTPFTFQKLYINTHELYTNKHILHTNKIYV